MAKKCKVLINNEAVTVVKFGDVEVQLPAIGSNAETVMVDCKDGKYSIVDEADKEEVAVEPQKEEPEKAEETTEKKIEKKENGFKPFPKR